MCRAGSLSAAARKLNMSQPSVSVSIAQLERAVGTALFERSRTGITLGRAGNGYTTAAAAQSWYDRLDAFLAKYNPAE